MRPGVNVPVSPFCLPRTNVASSGIGNADNVAVRTVAAEVDTEQMPEGFTFQWSQAAIVKGCLFGTSNAIDGTLT